MYDYGKGCLLRYMLARFLVLVTDLIGPSDRRGLRSN